MSLESAVFELFVWVRGSSSDRPSNHFTALLFNLIQKADSQNMARLRLAFPSECTAFELWRSAPSEAEFFRSFGLELYSKPTFV